MVSPAKVQSCGTCGGAVHTGVSDTIDSYMGSNALLLTNAIKAVVAQMTAIVVDRTWCIFCLMLLCYLYMTGDIRVTVDVPLFSPQRYTIFRDVPVCLL